MSRPENYKQRQLDRVPAMENLWMSCPNVSTRHQSMAENYSQSCGKKLAVFRISKTTPFPTGKWTEALTQAKTYLSQSSQESAHQQKVSESRQESRDDYQFEELTAQKIEINKLSPWWGEAYLGKQRRQADAMLTYLSPLCFTGTVEWHSFRVQNERNLTQCQTTPLRQLVTTLESSFASRSGVGTYRSALFQGPTDKYVKVQLSIPSSMSMPLCVASHVFCLEFGLLSISIIRVGI